MLQVIGEVLLKYLALLAGFMLLAGITGCSSATDFQVVEHSIIVTEYAGDPVESVAVVKGVARNTGYWPLEGCGVSVTFYDYQGNKLDVYSNSCQRLGPGENWNFNAVLKGPEAWKVARYGLSTFNK